MERVKHEIPEAYRGVSIQDLARQQVVRFKDRYQDFLKNFDCYCAVDLGEGEFAFEEFWEYEDEDEWCSYLDQERWEDLRVAVAEFKKLTAKKMAAEIDIYTNDRIRVEVLGPAEPD